MGGAGAITAGGGFVTLKNVGQVTALADLDVTAATINLTGPTVRVNDQGLNVVTFDGNVVLATSPPVITINTNGGSGNIVVDGKGGTDSYDITPLASRTITVGDSGGYPDSCYMWRRDGALQRNRGVV